MDSKSSPPHKHERDHASYGVDESSSCCSGTGPQTAKSVETVNLSGRSFQVSGLDCVEEVSILRKVVGPKVGGPDQLAFDVINGRMSVATSEEEISDKQIIDLVASTGMSASPWEDDKAAADQASHLSRQRWFTFLSGGFWVAGFVWHIIETGLGGAVGIFSGHGETTMPLPEIALFGIAIACGVWLVAPKAWSSARRLSPDMNLLHLA